MATHQHLRAGKCRWDGLTLVRQAEASHLLLVLFMRTGLRFFSLSLSPFLFFSFAFGKCDSVGMNRLIVCSSFPHHAAPTAGLGDGKGAQLLLVGCSLSTHQAL